MRRVQLIRGLTLAAAGAAGAAAGTGLAAAMPDPAAVVSGAAAVSAAAAAAALLLWLRRRRGMTAAPVSAQQQAGAEGRSASTEAMYRRLAREYEAIAGELQIALEAQRKWQPPVDLNVGVYRVTARNRQAQEVGGDLFDAAVVGDTTIALLAGDVPGKGLQAALMVPALMVLFRSELRQGGGAADILGRMNRLLVETGAVSGVTLGVGLLDAVTGELRYAGAGHPAPYLSISGAPPRQLDSSSLPLGISASESYSESVISLAPGERFVLYTDGIVEASAADGELFGFDRFEAALADWPAEMAASDWMDDLLREQDDGYNRRKDDRTLLVVERITPIARPSVRHDRTWVVRAVPGCEQAIIPSLTAMIRDAWPEAGRTDDIVTCVAEAVMNAAEHGSRYDAEKSVTVQVHFGSMLMVCRVRDEGAGFDTTPYRTGEPGGTAAQREAARERADGRGWGMLLIERLSDYWTAERDERGCCVELYFLAQQRTH